MHSTSQVANVFGNDNIIVQVSGSGVNVTVEAGRAYLRLTQYERRTKLAARDNSEVGLLSAYRADVVPLIGRDREMADLRRWLNHSAEISVRVLVGAGGRGKTRLALELARAVSKEGWLAGFVTAEELDRFRGQNGIEQWRWDKPVLIIFDYAASRASQIGAWLRELVDASLEDRPKLRLLLLERQAHRAVGWLAAAFGLGDDDDSRAAITLLDPPEPVELPTIDEVEFRRELFAALLRSSNNALEAPAAGADCEFDRMLAEYKWAGDPLFLMMAGLVAAKVNVREAFSLSRADLAFSLARHELDRIGKIGAALGVDQKQNRPGAFVRHMAVMATLTQGLTLTEARMLAMKEREAIGSAASIDATIEALTDALPALDGGPGLAPILPDVIGEAAVLAWLDHGAESVVSRAAQIARVNVSSTLVRTAQDFASAGFAEPIRWLEAMAHAPETDLGALMEIASSLPKQTVALRQLAVAMQAQIAVSMREAAAVFSSKPEVQSTYAGWLTSLGAHLSYWDSHKSALGATKEAVEIYRRLSVDRPGDFEHKLAGALTNLSGCLHELGRREDALGTAEEAVEIYRRLTADQPDAFLPDLARSLHNLGNRLGESGEHKDALGVVEEAVKIKRRFAAARPGASIQHELGLSLDSLATILSALGRREDALRAAEEAAEIYRRLTVDQPDAFRPDLARSLCNLSIRLSELDQREDGLRAAEEAVEIYRRLTVDQPDRFLPDLAASLHNSLRSALSDLGRREDELRVAEEVVEIYRRLIVDRPDVFLADLATSLYNVGTALSKLDRHADSVAAVREASDIYRRLFAERPGVFMRHLAASLSTLAWTLNKIGLFQEALAQASQAIKIMGPDFLERPAAYAREMNFIAQQYVELSKKVGVEPDATTLNPIVEVFQKLNGSNPGGPSRNA